MRKVLKIAGILLGVLALVIAGAAIYVKAFLPNVGPAPEMKIVSTPEKVARGKYLAHHVTICMDCHSARDWNYFAAPMIEDSLGKGGELFDERAGFPGTIYAANITPAAIGDWTDGEIFRAITTGVRKNGKPIFPVMPYHGYGKLDTRDIESIICYLRTLKPIEYTVPESKYTFPMNFIINTIPQKAAHTVMPDSGNSVAYGKYLITAAACGECHTPFEKGKFDTTKFLAGGRSFQMPGGLLTSVNLTPDDQTGTGTWSKEMFMDKFRAYRDSTHAHRKINFMSEFSTVMPWQVYSGMTDHDLGAIYDYLQSISPISNKINRFVPYSASK